LPRNASRECHALAALAIAACALVGCTPAIGDRCTLSTDCSVQGNRLCDTTQPGGYCTALQCTADKCPDNATCVELGASVPGCRYDDYSAPSRVASARCLKTCSSDSDCRQTDGYVCASPATPAGSAVILDSNQSKRVCLLAATPPTFQDAQVCSSSRAFVPPLEASAPTEAPGDAGAEEGGADAGQDGAGPESGIGDEATADGLADVSVDTTLDFAADSAAPDAGVGQ
jgi:hypothetical protein